MWGEFLWGEALWGDTVIAAVSVGGAILLITDSFITIITLRHEPITRAFIVDSFPPE